MSSSVTEYVVTPLSEGSVTYDEGTNTVTFPTTQADQCARVEIDAGSGFFVYYPCAPTHSGSVAIDESQHVDRMRVSLCVTHRPDICSTPVEALISEFIFLAPLSLLCNLF